MKKFAGVGCLFGGYTGYPFEEDWRPLSRIPLSSMRASQRALAWGIRGGVRDTYARHVRHMLDTMRDTKLDQVVFCG